MYSYDDGLITGKGVRRSRSNTSLTVVRLRQRRSKMALLTVLCLPVFCFAYYVSEIYEGTNFTPHDAFRRPQPTERSILIVLEAETVPANPTIDDLDRQLTAKGMRDAEGLGIYLDKHKIPEPEWIFASTSERTAYTTELIRHHWSPEVTVAFENVLYILEYNDYFTFVAGLNDHFRRVMIVGHNPAILNTAKKLLRTHGIEEFPDCGFMEIVWKDLPQWKDVQPYSGSSTLAIDPHNNFFFTAAQGDLLGGRSIPEKDQNKQFWRINFLQ